MFGGTGAIFRNTSLLVLAFLLAPAAMPEVRAQAYERDLSISARSLLTIKNRAGHYEFPNLRNISNAASSVHSIAPRGSPPARGFASVATSG